MRPRPADPDETPTKADPVPINREQALALAELVCAVRPSWQARGVVKKGLAPLAHHPAPLEVIAWAALRAAADREILTPAAIPLNGPHWNLADRPPEPRLTPEHECPKHPGQWRDLCRSCRADVIADTSRDPDPLEGDHLTNAQRAREAARKARDRHLYGDDEQLGPVSNQEQPDPTPSVLRMAEEIHRREDAERLEYGTPEHARAHHEQHPHRVGMAPEARRRSAAADAGAKLEARRTGQLCDTTGCYWPEEDHNHAVDPVPSDPVDAT